MKYFAIQNTSSLEVMGVVNEEIKNVLVHLLGNHIIVTEVENSFGNGTIKDGDLSWCYLGLQTKGTYMMKDILQLKTKEY